MRIEQLATGRLGTTYAANGTGERLLGRERAYNGRKGLGRG